MDNELAANDPYKKMDSAEDNVQPDFLKDISGGASKLAGSFEQAASVAMAAKGGGGAKLADNPVGQVGQAGEKAGGKAGGSAGGLGGNVDPSKNLESGFKSGTSPTEKAKASEESPDSLYKGDKKSRESNVKGDNTDEESLGMPSSFKAMTPVLALIAFNLFSIVLMVGLPVIMIGAIDAGLQKAVGITGTTGVLEEQGEYVTVEIAKSGKFPSKYSSDLARNGIDVGQVTANGDFIKTDTYIANIEERDDLVAAASGFSYSSDEEGELALLYDGNVIRADDFVAAVESDPKLYAAYSDAADIDVKYYYGKDVSKVFDDMKISRGNFNNWESTGDYKADEKSYNEIMEKVLDGKTNADINLGGVHEDQNPLSGIKYKIKAFFGADAPGTYIENVSTGEADKITGTIADKTKSYIKDWEVRDDVCYNEKTSEDGTTTNEYYECQVPIYDDTQTKRAAELLNTAISAKEPYIAARAFVGIEEPIQRARIGDNGPVNEVMNSLSTPTSVTYKDVVTGNTVTKTQSVFETVNFQAAVGEKPYSKDEAASFARDRVLQVTGQGDEEIIKNTMVSSDGLAKTTTAIRNGNKTSADKKIISQANDSVSMAITQKNSDLFESIVGANRILEGGSFLSNNINQKVIGAMPSNDDTVSSYQTELNKVIARKEAADRAKLSPFDISSPNTFLGSIVHNLATAMMGVYSSSSTSILSAVQAAGNVAGTAVTNILGTVTAEGADQHFTSLSSSYCKTPNTIDVAGDLFCNSHNTVSTEKMSFTLEQWQNSSIGDSIDEEGNIVEGSDLEKFVIMGMDRESSVGTKSAEVCQAWTDYNAGFFEKIKHFFGEIFGTYTACDGVDENVANGTEYSFTNGQNPDLYLYSGYMLYNQVRSLLTNEDSAVAVARERYYAKHPKDESEAGELARISGMTKSEAEVALAYMGYLNEIANYDPSGRYIFNELDFTIQKPVLLAHSDAVMENLYAWHREEIEYRDARNREVATA